MIHLTRLNRGQLVVNSDLIEHIESTPDTVIALTTGEKILVLETVEEVIERVRSFRRSLFSGVRFCACTGDTLPAPHAAASGNAANGF